MKGDTISHLNHDNSITYDVPRKSFSLMRETISFSSIFSLATNDENVNKKIGNQVEDVQLIQDALPLRYYGKIESVD